MYIKSTYDGLHVITGTTEHVSTLGESGGICNLCSVIHFFHFLLPEGHQTLDSMALQTVLVTNSSPTKGKKKKKKHVLQFTNQ